MALLTFKGGIHPDDGKSLAKDKAIVDVKPKGDLVYPVSQHIGAPANPVVAVGDHVLKGQMIAEAGGFVSAPIYASVSGTVKAIAPHLNPTGGRVNSIVIENDGEYKEVEYPAVTPLEDMSKEDILNAIGTAGVVGMGGAGFPTRVKLSPKEPEKIDYIIANCAECEPYITADYRTMIETPEKLVGGMKIILRLFDNAKGIFGVEDNKPDCIEKLRELTKDEPRMEVLALKTKYPQGGERQLIYAYHCCHIIYNTSCVCRKHCGINCAPCCRRKAFNGTCCNSKWGRCCRARQFQSTIWHQSAGACRGSRRI